MRWIANEMSASYVLSLALFTVCSLTGIGVAQLNSFEAVDGLYELNKTTDATKCVRQLELADGVDGLYNASVIAYDYDNDTRCEQGEIRLSAGKKHPEYGAAPLGGRVILGKWHNLTCGGLSGKGKRDVVFFRPERNFVSPAPSKLQFEAGITYMEVQSSDNGGVTCVYIREELRSTGIDPRYVFLIYFAIIVASIIGIFVVIVGLFFCVRWLWLRSRVAGDENV